MAVPRLASALDPGDGREDVRSHDDKDVYENIAGGYTGTVHFTSSDAKAALPVNYTFAAADAGAHTFGAALKTATAWFSPNPG